MKPLTLTMKNFGPYINETVDFRAFEDSSLFLISGKTGSGKTTIFDGMSYALFGESSGKLRQGKELRSTFADPSEATEVRLLFSHGALHYEISRKPEQELFKKRGDGTRTQPAKISLLIKNPDGKELKEYTKRREVDSFIQELLHLDAEQFSQIVLLPQGEFRTFLIANSSEKEKVLRRLFSTQMYQALGEELKLRSKAKNQEIDQIRQEMEAQLKQVHWWEEKPQDELMEKQLQALSQQQDTAAKEQQQLALKVKGLKDELKQIERAKQEIEEQNDLTKQYATLLAEQEALALKRGEIDGVRKKVQELLWVKTQAASLELIEENEQELVEQQQRKAEASEEIETVSKNLNDYKQLVEKLADRKEEMEEKHLLLAELTRNLPLYEEKEALEKKLSGDRLDQLREQMADEQRKNEELLVEQSKLEEAVAEQPRLERQQLLLEQRQKDWQKIAEEWQSLSVERERHATYQKNLLSLEKELLESETIKTRAEQEKRQAQSFWAKMQISRLSLLLEEGEPCPVCGALEHPKQQEHSEVSLTEIQEAEAQLNEAEEKLKIAEEKVISLLKDIEALQEQSEQLGSTLDKQQAKLIHSIEELKPIEKESVNESWIEAGQKAALYAATENDKALELLESKKFEQSAVKEQLERQQQLLSDLKNRLDEKQTEHKMLQVKIATLLEQLDGELSFSEASEQQQQLEKELSKWVQESEQAEQRLIDCGKQQQRLDQEKTQLDKEIDRIKKLLEVTREKVRSSLKEQGLTYQLEELGSLLEQLTKLTELQEKIASFDEKNRAIAYQVQAIKNRMVDTELPILAEIEQQLERKQQEISEEDHAYHQREAKYDRNKEILEEIMTAIRAMDTKWTEVAALQQLADTINGDNLKKTSLERYVLQTYLRDVLRTANIRMASLTNGRYQFELNSEKNSYKNQTGLEIDIYDDNAGASRSARTLSGGESFIAALALALSLAEVIQEQAGGVLIEALFIDEGFGSLDEEALEMAIEALETIENEGRMIGIISHVAELKSRITQQLQIKTNGAGQSSVSIK